MVGGGGELCNVTTVNCPKGVAPLDRTFKSNSHAAFNLVRRLAALRGCFSNWRARARRACVYSTLDACVFIIQCFSRALIGRVRARGALIKRNNGLFYMDL